MEERNKIIRGLWSVKIRDVENATARCIGQNIYMLGGFYRHSFSLIMTAIKSINYIS